GSGAAANSPEERADAGSSAPTLDAVRQPAVGILGIEGWYAAAMPWRKRLSGFGVRGFAALSVLNALLGVASGWYFLDWRWVGTTSMGFRLVGGGLLVDHVRYRSL